MHACSDCKEATGKKKDSVLFVSPKQLRARPSLMGLACAQCNFMGRFFFVPNIG
jgi:hypothetical protein